MSAKQPTEKELLKTVLEPLLEDFQYWFERSRSLLESEKISFFEPQEQAQLLEKIVRSQKEVKTAQMLFQATGGSAGIDSQLLLPWHKLVAECWSVAQKWRELKNKGNRISPGS